MILFLTNELSEGKNNHVENFFHKSLTFHDKIASHAEDEIESKFH